MAWAAGASEDASTTPLVVGDFQSLWSKFINGIQRSGSDMGDTRRNSEDMAHHPQATWRHPAHIKAQRARSSHTSHDQKDARSEPT